MSYFLKAKKLDITSGESLICLINDKDAEEFGIGLNRGDRVELKIDNVEKPIIVVIDTTDNFVEEGQIGIYEDIWQEYGIEEDAVAEMKLFNKSKANPAKGITLRSPFFVSCKIILFFSKSTLLHVRFIISE